MIYEYIERDDKCFIGINYQSSGEIDYIDNILYERKPPIRYSYDVIEKLGRLNLQKVNFYIKDYNKDKLIMFGYYINDVWVHNPFINYVNFFRNNNDCNYTNYLTVHSDMDALIYIEIPSKNTFTKFKLIF